MVERVVSAGVERVVSALQSQLRGQEQIRPQS